MVKTFETLIKEAEKNFNTGKIIERKVMRCNNIEKRESTECNQNKEKKKKKFKGKSRKHLMSIIIINLMTLVDFNFRKWTVKCFKI